MKRANALTVRTRIIISFLSFVILPFFMMFLIGYRYFVNYAYQMSIENQTNNLYSAQKQVDDICNTYKDLSMLFYYNGYDEKILNDKARQAEMEQDLEVLLHSSGGLEAIVLQTENDLITVGQKFRNTRENLMPYISLVSKAKGKVVFLPIQTFAPKAGAHHKNLLIMGRTLYDKSRKEIGILWMLLDSYQIQKVFSRTNFLDGSMNYLLLQNGELAYAVPGANVTGKEEMEGLRLEREVKAGSLRERIWGENSLIVYDNSFDTRYTMLSILPEKEILREFRGIEWLFLLCLSILFLFILAMFRILKHQIFLPVENLISGVDRFANGDQDVQLAVTETGEMKKITDHFNYMVIKVSGLMDRVKSEEKEKNEFKIQALMMQMSPHFIYNSLNTIKWIAVINKQENIRNLVDSLIQIFRNMLKQTDENNTISEELKLIKHYANIQKARFLNFDLVIEAQEETLMLNIKRFLLQPIVENAIIHGISQSVENGEIKIRVWHDQYLHIEVRDNGKGFLVDSFLEQPKKEDKHAHIGLLNVRQMIQLEYGAPYGMEIESTPGIGTCVTYLLPLSQIADET